MADLRDLYNSVINRLEALEQYNKTRGHTGPGTGERFVSDDHGVTIMDAAMTARLNTGSARIPPLETEPKSDWEREKRFWKDHPVDRFDLNDPGPEYEWTPKMEKSYSGFGEWVRAEDYRKAIELLETKLEQDDK